MKKILALFTVLTLLVASSSFALTTLNTENVDTEEQEKEYYKNENTKKPLLKSDEKVIDNSEIDQSSVNITSTSDDFDFERSIFEEDSWKVYQDKAEEIVSNKSELRRTFSKISPDLENIIKNLNNDLSKSYITKEKPGLSKYYDLSNEKRKQNLSLLELYGYQAAISKIDLVDDISNDIEINKLDKLNNEVIKLDYTITIRFKHSDDNSVGNDLYNDTVYLINTTEGFKIIKFWRQSQDFAYMEQLIKEKTVSGIKSFTTAISEDEIEKYIKDQTDKNIEQALEAKPYDDNLEEDTNQLISTRATTITYDRQAVVNAALKYAIKPNPLFVEQINDCANFVSQSIWQSPQFSFDKIGNSDDYKWSCTKNSQGKYDRDIPVWAGVVKFYNYCLGNDNKNVAGTVHGLSAKTSGNTLDSIQLGDVVQFKHIPSSYTGTWGHSGIVVKFKKSSNRKTSDIVLAAHTDNTDNRTIAEFMAKDYIEDYRLIHINNYIVN